MALLDAAMAYFAALERKIGLPPALRRVVWVLLLLVVGWFDYITPQELAWAPFYILVLLPLPFFESLGVCLAYSVLAATIYLGADVLTSPATVTLIYPYWRAVASLISFSLISTTISLLVGERKRLQLSEEALREKAQELDAKNRALDETLRALNMLQEEIMAKERQAAIAETINSATYEIERPLISISVYVDDLLRSVESHEDIHPLVEKIAERVGDMEEILKNIRELRKERPG